MILWLLALASNPAGHLPTEVRRVSAVAPQWWHATARRERAVILIHGLKLYPLRPVRAEQTEVHDWQQSGSELVRALSADCDVFAFAYAQTLPVDLIARSPQLRDAVAGCKAAGYREVILIGHSAGGLLARLFTEAHPECGVTKVIQVGAPHAGAEIANAKIGYPPAQAPFVRSLKPDVRMAANREAAQFIAPRVQVVCVVTKLRGLDNDGLVTVASQWPPLLQQQGVPAVLLHDNHWTAMKMPAGVCAIAELVRDPLVRWTPDQVEVARKVLFRDPEK